MVAMKRLSLGIESRCLYTLSGLRLYVSMNASEHQDLPIRCALRRFYFPAASILDSSRAGKQFNDFTSATRLLCAAFLSCAAREA